MRALAASGEQLERRADDRPCAIEAGAKLAGPMRVVE
jgi:hypothetical protein